MAFYYSNKFGGFIDVYPNNLKELPIAQPTANILETIESIVSQILKYRKENENCDILINRLDLMVYKLYRLTYDECKIVDPTIEKQISREDYENKTIEELAFPEHL